MSSNKSSAIVLFSGGQDSTTCLLWAKEQFDEIIAVTFYYEQRHHVEIESASHITQLLDTPHVVLNLDILSQMTENALTRKDMDIEEPTDDLPNTYVEGRNHLFLSFAAIEAKKRGIKDIVGGMCQTDYSGYPDCRAEFVQSLEKTLQLAMDYPFKIHTPLMHKTKCETVELCRDLGNLDILKFTHTCYKGVRPACGECPACKLRLKGFEQAGEKDPLPYEEVLFSDDIFKD